MDPTAERATLREALRVLQERYDRLVESSAEQLQQLTDENEVLADANRLLLARQTQQPKASHVPDVPSLFYVPDELLLPVPAPVIRLCATREKVHAFGNLLSVSVHATRRALVATGGADKCVCVHDWQTGTPLAAAETSGPVLALAFNPSAAYADYFVAAGMDARHALYKVVPRGDAWHVDVVAPFHDHTRHGTVRVAWSASGCVFATGASDKVVNVYQCAGLDEAAGVSLEQWKKVKSFYFNGTIEALVFAPDVVSERVDASGELGHEVLVIAVRDDCYVHYVDCVTFEKERINMNSDGIEHVSYTIMDLSLSPSGKYLLAATDSNRNFIFAVKQSAVLRSFYGHKAGPYSQPRAVWHPSEKYVISNNEDSGAIFVWSVASERVVKTFDAHDGLVRDLVCPAPASATELPMLITVSYDKRMKVWELPLAKGDVTVM